MPDHLHAETPGQQLVLLHGALGSADAMMPFADLLHPDFQVYVPELPGHGKHSHETAEISIPSLVEFLETFIRNHRLEQPLVFGYSMGGYIAMAHALQYPGVISQVITLATKFRWSPEEAVKEGRMLSASMIKTKVPAFAALLQARHGTEHWEGVISRTAELMGLLGDNPVLTPDNVTAIQIPVTVALGAEDRMVTVEESEAMVRALPAAQFLLLEGIPHPLEKIPPERIRALIHESLY